MIENTNRTSFSRTNDIWILSDQLLGSVCVFFTTILIARGLSITNFGWFATTTLVQLLLLGLQNALVSGPCQLAYAETKMESRKKYADAVFSVESLFILVIILLSSLIILWGGGARGHFLPAWWWILLATCGFLLHEFLKRQFILEENYTVAFVLGAFSSLLQLIFLSLYYFQDSLDFVLCFKITGLSYLPSVLLGVYWLKLKAVSKSEILETVHLHWSTGKWLIITSVLQWGSTNFFIASAGYLLGMAAFAAIRLGQSIFNIINTILQVAENFAIPGASRIYELSARKFKSYLRDVSLKTILLSLPLLAGLWFFAEPVLAIMGGEEYQPYAVVLQGLAVLQLFIFLGYPLRIALRVMLLNKVFFIGYIITCLFSLLAARTFIYWADVQGVMLGLIANQLLIFSYWQFVLHRKKFLIWN